MGYYLNDEWSGGSSAPLDQPQPPPRMTIGGVPVNTTADGVRIDDPTPPAPAPSADTAFGRSYDMVEDTLKHLRAYHDSVGEHAAEYSQDGLAMQLKRFGETPEARALDEAEAMADQRVAELAEEAEQARRDLAKEPDPVQSTRIWSRHQRIWDNKTGPELVGAVQKSIASATPEELGVLMNETEPYLESRGLPTTIVEPVLEQAAPEYAAKKARAAKAEKARQIQRDNLRKVRQGIAAGAAPKTPLLRPDTYDPDR